MDHYCNSIKEGWLTDQFQEGFRQPDESKRKGKYCFYFDQVPKEYKLFVRNFNQDRDDFAEEHGHPFIGNF